AYTGALDPAAHAFRGLTPRTAVLYGEPGHAYVYFIYGMHWCLNVSTRPAGQAGGVLFRAAQIVGEAPAPLSGPGRLTRALAITGALNGCDLTRPGPLFLADDGCTPRSIAVTTRVGIRHARHLPYRFFVEGARAVTAPRSPILARLPPAAARPPFSGRPSAATPARQRTGGPSDGRAAAETRSAAIRAPAAQGASKLPR
ncbi:MAG: DNA-3-methyladenine glycosylase, partial [Terriglobales bacterium]